MKLSKVLLNVAECLKGVRYGTSTDLGTTTTLIDSLMDEPDKWFNGGTVWFLTGALADKTAVISAYASATHTFTFTAALSSAPLSGIQYAALRGTYTRDALVSAINKALLDLGPLPSINESLLTVAEQESYTLPAGVSNILRVQVSNGDDYDPPHQYWKEINGKIYFTDEAPSEDGMLIRLWYNAVQPFITLDADEVTDQIHPMRLAWTAAYYAALTRSGQAENSEPHSKEMIGIASQMQAMATAHPLPYMARDKRMSGW